MGRVSLMPHSFLLVGKAAVMAPTQLVTLEKHKPQIPGVPTARL